MKTSLFFSIALTALLVNPTIFKAQSPVFKEATIARPAELWQPIKLNAEGGNVQNGVQFYAHGGECKSGKVKFLKLINLNAYPVKFTYQVSADSPIVSVLVPASFSVEGSCSATDENLAKLVITVPVGKTEEETKKNKEYLRSHMTVSQIQY